MFEEKKIKMRIFLLVLALIRVNLVSAQNIVEDIDGNKYSLYLFDDKFWTTKNLEVTRFRNGDIIEQVNTLEEWQRCYENEKPAWCYYENLDVNGKIYGKLYNWYAINDPRGLAPEGWRIPTTAEWSKMKSILKKEESIKQITNVADNVKENSVFSDYKKMFSILTGGYRFSDGFFQGKGIIGVFWSTTEFHLVRGESQADLADMAANNFGYKSVGASVRLIKDM